MDSVKKIIWTCKQNKPAFHFSPRIDEDKKEDWGIAKILKSNMLRTIAVFVFFQNMQMILFQI